MKVFVFVAMLVAVGCSAASKPIASSPKLDCEECPTCGECPTCRDCPDRERALVFVGGPGFWCLDHALPKGPRLKECFRVESTCNYVREKEDEKEPCERADRAMCFSMVDPAVQGTGFRCFGSEAHCLNGRTEYQKTREGVTFSECKWISDNEDTAQR